MKRIISLILAAIICSFAFAVPASALVYEEDCVVIESTRDVVFGVTWDVEQPATLVFIDPYGTEYNTAKSTNSTTTIVNGNTLYYVIKNAAAGQWRFRYDKGANTTIEVSAYDYEPGISIDYFTIGSIEYDRIPVNFFVSGDENQYFNYTISAVIDHSGTEKQLDSGSSRTGYDVSRSVYLGSLATYSNYMLKLYVWYTEDSTDIFDVSFSDKFSYTNSSADNRTFEYILTVRPEEFGIAVNWEGLSWSAESVMVALFEDGASEPITFEEYDPDKYDRIELGYAPESKNVSVEVSVKFNGIFTSPKRTDLNVSSFGITIPDGESFNSVLLPLTYKGMNNQAVKVTVNNYSTDLNFNGDGSVNVTLGDGWNDFFFTYTDTNNITWEIERRIYIDRNAPVLSMSRSYDGITVAGETLTVSGTVADCSVLTVNGTVVEVSNGTFATDVALEEGSNIITVVATDALGNETMYTAGVIRQTAAADASGAEGSDASGGEPTPAKPGTFFHNIMSGYWMLIISGVLCLLVIIYALIFWRKKGSVESPKKEKQPKKEKKSKSKKEKKSDNNDGEVM